MVVLNTLDAVQLSSSSSSCTPRPQQDSDALALLAACMDAMKQYQIVLQATSNLNILLGGLQQQHKQQQASCEGSARGGSHRRGGSAVADDPAAPSAMQHSAALGALLVHNGNHAAVLLMLLEKVVRLTSQQMQEPANRQVQAAASQLFNQAIGPSWWRAIASVLQLLCTPSLGGSKPEALPLEDSPSGSRADVQQLGHAPAFPSSSGGGGGGSTTSSSAWVSENGRAADRELTARWQSLLDGPDGSRTSAAPNANRSCFQLLDPAMTSPDDLHHSSCSLLELCCLALQTGWQLCRAGWAEPPDTGAGTTSASNLHTLHSPEASRRVLEALSASGLLNALCEVLLAVDPHRPFAAQCDFARIRVAWDAASCILTESAERVEWVAPDTGGSSSRGGAGGGVSRGSSGMTGLLLQMASGPSVQRLLLAVAETSLQEVLQDSSIVLPLATRSTTGAGGAAAGLAAAADQAASAGPANTTNTARTTHSDQPLALSSAAASSGSGSGVAASIVASACTWPAGSRWPLLDVCPLHYDIIPASVLAPNGIPGPLNGAIWASLTAGRLWRCALQAVEVQLKASGRPCLFGRLMATAALPPCQQLASVAAQVAQLAVRCVEGRVAQGGETCSAAFIGACLDMQRCLHSLQQVLPRRSRGTRDSSELAAAANAQHLAAPPLPAMPEALSWVLRLHVLMQLAAPPQSSLEQRSGGNRDGDAECSTGQRPRRQQRQTAAALGSISVHSDLSKAQMVMNSVTSLACALQDEDAGEPCSPCTNQAADAL